MPNPLPESLKGLERFGLPFIPTPPGDCSYEMASYPDGEFVRLSDVAALLAEQERSAPDTPQVSDEAVEAVAQKVRWAVKDLPAAKRFARIILKECCRERAGCPERLRVSEAAVMAAQVPLLEHTLPIDTDDPERPDCAELAGKMLRAALPHLHPEQGQEGRLREALEGAAAEIEARAQAARERADQGRFVERNEEADDTYRRAARLIRATLQDSEERCERCGGKRVIGGTQGDIHRTVTPLIPCPNCSRDIEGGEG